MRIRRCMLACLVSLLSACAGSRSAPANTPASPSPSAEAETEIEGPTAAGAATPFAWSSFDEKIFPKAKAERRFVILDGAAEWCHFCHVMEEKTYADARVRELVEKQFIAAKVDIDTRPDIEERYGDWGWPATVIFSPDGEELGKYRGFIAPDDFLEILRTVASGSAKVVRDGDAMAAAPKSPLTDRELDAIERDTEAQLESSWDDQEGGWGKQPKVPIGWNALFALSRARDQSTDGAKRLRDHALTVLDKQTKIIDPVWGGIYQYSVAADWDHPHYEKLMVWNAGALASYAEAFALTRDPNAKRRANDIRRFLDAFMVAPDGAFYSTQDADLNAHRADVPFAPTSPRGSGSFLKGAEYYRLDDAGRRRLGVPRIDPNEYADGNGLALFAYATLARTTDDAAALATAKRAADRILASHSTKLGGLTHLAQTGGDAPATGPLHLSDAAAFGYGLLALNELIHEPRYGAAGAQIAEFVTKELYDEGGGGFFAQTRDDNAVGVFKTRRKPFDENVMALRFLIRFDRTSGTPSHRAVVEHSLRAISQKPLIEERGKFLGDYLMLLDEVRAYRGLREPVKADAKK